MCLHWLTWGVMGFQTHVIQRKDSNPPKRGPPLPPLSNQSISRDSRPLSGLAGHVTPGLFSEVKGKSGAGGRRIDRDLGSAFRSDCVFSSVWCWASVTARVQLQTPVTVCARVELMTCLYSQHMLAIHSSCYIDNWKWFKFTWQEKLVQTVTLVLTP